MYINKYKAWDTNKNIMYSAEELGTDELTINPDGRGFVNVNSVDVKLSQYCFHMIPLQFTHNIAKRVEVYQNDIIKFKTIENNMIEFGRVGFVDDGWAIVDNEGDYMIGLWDCIKNHSGKIIGNTFENVIPPSKNTKAKEQEKEHT